MEKLRTRMAVPPTFGFVITLRRPLRYAIDGGRGMMVPEGVEARKKRQSDPSGSDDTVETGVGGVRGRTNLLYSARTSFCKPECARGGMIGEEGHDG
jgi:hypothetical protein